ncbi:MAG: glycosyltransferase [Verrucomicrobiota bacterium]
MPEPLKIGLLFPWKGLPEMDRGSARRAVPLVHTLSEHFETVEVLSPGDKKAIFDRNITYDFFHDGPTARRIESLAYRLFEGATYHLWRGRVPLHERHQLWHFIHPYFQPSLRRAVRSLVSRVDVVLLKYPFWSSILPRGSKSKPVILSLYDVLSGAVSQPWLNRTVRRLELDACRRADEVVCCTEADADDIRSAGFHPAYIPHGIDLRAQPAPKIPEGPEFEKIDAHKKKGGLVGFFVGSSHKPNREAVEEIGKISGALLEEPGILIVAAGSCCGRMSPAGNLILLGPIPEDALDWLYSTCDVVLSPLRSGTGSSLKTIEALAKRKILVSSSVGARGYHLVSGRDAILSDDFFAYPGILRGLMKDKPLREKLSCGGWDFVQAFDSRKVYLPYVGMIKSVHSRRP